MTHKVCIGWVTAGQPEGDFMKSLLDHFIYDASKPEDQRHTLRYDRDREDAEPGMVYMDGGGYQYVLSGPRIASARNQLVRQFLDTPAWAGTEWLWMLDDDISFPPDTLDKLLDAAYEDGELVRPVVAGHYWLAGQGHMRPGIFRLVDPKENDGNAIAFITDWPEGAIVQADATGAGCLLMHRSVLEKMRETYPKPIYWFSESVYNEREFGEDWTFCMRLMQLGFPLYVHTGCDLGHVKKVTVTDHVYRTGQIPFRKEGEGPKVITRQMRRELERQAAKA